MAGTSALLLPLPTSASASRRRTIVSAKGARCSKLLLLSARRDQRHWRTPTNWRVRSIQNPSPPALSTSSPDQWFHRKTLPGVLLFRLGGGLDRADADRTVSSPDGSPEHLMAHRGVIVRLSVGRHLGRPSGRCVRMGSRVVESAATEDARPDDGSQDDSRSEVDAWGSSEDDEGLDSGARADPLRDKRRPAQGNRGALRRRPGCTVGGEVGVPCQPPPTPPNATTSTRGSLLAAARDTQRPPSRGRRRRDNDRPAHPGPACKEEVW